MGHGEIEMLFPKTVYTAMLNVANTMRTHVIAFCVTAQLPLQKNT